MPRKALERSNLVPYHVTARANNREDFHVSLNKLWTVYAGESLNLNWVYGVQIHALVLMPNHFHMIISVPQHDLGKVMNVFISSVTRISNLLSERSGHVFGGPYHWSMIRNSRYFGHALKYVYRNPVRAKLCSNVEEYPYSTLHGLLGLARLPFPIYQTQLGMELSLPSIDSYEMLDWLNRPFPKEAEAMIQLGLRRKIFDAVKDRNARRSFEALNNII